MTDWQVTATTIYCDTVDDEVTIIVRRDFTARCTGQGKYAASKNARRKSNKRLACAGPDCPAVSGYREKLRSEESSG